MRADIRIATQAFDPEAELAAFRIALSGAGAVVSFTGLVRPASDAGAVSTLGLQHYPGVTEHAIAETLADAGERWALEAALVIHRVGDLTAHEPIVLVAAASRHRRAAFEAADFLMDYLKSRALFWKSETSAQGKLWVEPRAADYADAARWGVG